MEMNNFFCEVYISRVFTKFFFRRNGGPRTRRLMPMPGSYAADNIAI
jgi:hypothetical protein